ncbi:MAG: ATP-binding protein, partial [Candidatus Eremiobacterota bacterium]
LWWMLPALVGLQLWPPASEPAVSRSEADGRQAPASSREQLQRARRDLERQLDQHLMLQELTRALARAPELEPVLDKMLRTGLRLVPGTSAAVFVEDEGHLIALGCHGPHAERSRSARLLGMEEPIVRRALDSQRPARAEPGDLQGPRLFQGEQAALAVPMPGVGVLYLGRTEPDPHTDDEMATAMVVADQGAVAIRCARLFRSYQDALQEQASARESLQGWVRRLEVLLEGYRTATSTLEPEAVLERLQAQVQDVLPHRWGALFLTREGEPTGRSWGPEEPVLEEAARVVATSAHPLLLESLAGSRFQPGSPDLASLVAVPVLNEEQTLVVVLGSDTPAAFQREHQDLLSALAFQAAAALRNARLHAQVVQAYDALRESEAQLIQSSKLAAVGQLAAGVAHELNTPLATLVLGLDAAMRQLEGRPDLARPKLEAARREALRAREIVEKLFFYSRDARAGRRSVDLNAVVADTLELLGHQLELDGVRLDLHQEPVPAVQANQNELQQVLTNLLINARDAVLEPGARERTVSLRTRCEGGHVVLEVADAGPGIPVEVRERIFDPFFTTKPVGKGTGLGLSISRQIAASHGGTLVLADEPSGDTRFVFRLPVLA